jgi:hypothetical protein
MGQSDRSGGRCGPGSVEAVVVLMLALFLPGVISELEVAIESLLPVVGAVGAFIASYFVTRTVENQ